MTKITIITCIIAAVCVFQTAEAGFLGPKSIINSVMDNLQKEISNPLGSIKDLEEQVENGLGISQNGTTECTKAYNEAQKALNELISSFKSCISNETGSASDKVENLMNAVNKLVTNITQEVKQFLTCIQQPLNIINCINDIQKDISKLAPDVKDVVDKAYELIGFFPSVGKCYQNAFNQAIGQNAKRLVKDVQECVTSVIKPIFF